MTRTISFNDFRISAKFQGGGGVGVGTSSTVILTQDKRDRVDRERYRES